MSVRTNLYVLRRTQMPAVLVELGFITNPGDAELMSTRLTSSPKEYITGSWIILECCD